MGDHAAITALEWNIAREAQDELAASSHQNGKKHTKKVSSMT